MGNQTSTSQVIELENKMADLQKHLEYLSRRNLNLENKNRALTNNHKLIESEKTELYITLNNLKSQHSETLNDLRNSLLKSNQKLQQENRDLQSKLKN